MRQFVRKVAWYFGRRQKEEEIREEIEFHIDAETRELDSDGLGLDELRVIPGIEDASLSGFAPLSGSSRRRALYFPDREGPPIPVATINVHPDFFRTMGMALVDGRGFNDGDGLDSPQVAIVNEAFVRTYLESGSVGDRGANRPVPAIGSRLGFLPLERDGVEVVGVVADARYNTLREPAPPVVYTSDAQGSPGTSSRTFEVRTAGPPEAMAAQVRAAVGGVDPRLPILGLATFSDSMEVGLAAERIFAWVTTLFAGLALGLSMTGLFGLASYTVAQRTREIGIRMALGARRETVLGQTIWDAIRPVAFGIAIGIAATLALTPVLGNLVFGLAPYDPITIGAAAGLMLVVAILAGYIPARRASRVDPVDALRND